VGEAFVSVYRRRRAFVVISSVGAAEMSVDAPPVFVVDGDASDDVLGSAVTTAATEARTIPRWLWWWVDLQAGRWERAILSTVGVKDLNTLQRNANLVEVERHSGGWTIRPLRRTRKGRWIRMTDDDELPAMREIRLEVDPAPAAIGSAVRAALARPTPTA